MGWLFMRNLRGHNGPRAYLDAQFTLQNERVRQRVLRSTIKSGRVYYAAIEQIEEGHDPIIFAAVCLIRYNLRAKDGYVFGYKDMDENVGPCESECPAVILDLLTPTDQEFAISWRARCRANLEHPAWRRPQPGQTIVFDDAITFTNGETHTTFQVAAHPQGKRSLVFRAIGGFGYYRISGLKQRKFRLHPSVQNQQLPAGVPPAN